MAKITLEALTAAMYADVPAYIDGRLIEHINTGMTGDVYDGVWRVLFADSDEYVPVSNGKYTMVDLGNDEQQPDESDYNTCPECGGAFGFGASYEPNADICPVCGNVLDTRPEDDYDWSDWFPTYDELTEDTAPLSERADVVGDALKEDELRAGMAAIDAWIEDILKDDGQEQPADGLAWWWDVPIPFSITPRGRDYLDGSAG